MTKDIIVSRQCMVGPNGYHGFDKVDGSVIVRVDFFRPEPDPEDGTSSFPTHWCEYQITYDGVVIDADKMCGMDSVAALLSAMVDAVRSFEGPYFNKIEADKRYYQVIPYISAIPPEWFQDMRFAGTWPTWTAEEPVVFQHPDGRRVPGRIALGYPAPTAEDRAECQALLEGLDGRVETLEADTPLTALQLAIASLAGKLRPFLASGGRVLRPEGDADADLEAFFGPMLRPADPVTP